MENIKCLSCGDNKEERVLNNDLCEVCELFKSFGDYEFKACGDCVRKYWLPITRDLCSNCLKIRDIKEQRKLKRLRNKNK